MPAAADPVDPARARAGDHLALAGQGRAGDPPAVVDAADPLRIRDPGAVEEDLAEVDLAGDVAQRPDVDARAGAGR